MKRRQILQVNSNSTGQLNIQFDNGKDTSEDNIYTIAFIELDGTENNLIGNRVFIGASWESLNVLQVYLLNVLIAVPN